MYNPWRINWISSRYFCSCLFTNTNQCWHWLHSTCCRGP
jgi:hypothetical protein